MHLQSKFVIFSLLNPTSVIRLCHCCTATVYVTTYCCSLLFLLFAVFGSLWAQHVLQYIFAFARGQIVEEVQWGNFNEPKREI